MANIDKLLEILQQKAFYEAGGGRKPDSEAIAQILSGIGGGLKSGVDTYTDIRAKNLAAQKARQEMAPIGDYLGIPEQGSSQEQALADVFNRGQQSDQDAARNKVKQFFSGSQGPVTQEGVTPAVQATSDYQAMIPPPGKFVSPADKFKAENVVSRDAPTSVYKEIQEGKLKQAQANYYNSGQKGGSKLYVDVNPKSPTFREVSPTPLPGYVEVSSNVGAGIAVQPGKEDVNQEFRREMMKSNQDFQKIVREDALAARKDAEEIKRKDRLDKMILAYGKEIDNDPILKNLKTQSISLDTANQLSELAKAGNTVAAAALGMKEARGLGEVGVVTEQDVKRYVISGRLDRKAGDTLRKWLQGKPSDATLDEIVAINEVIKDSLAKKVQPLYNKKINRFARTMGMTPEDAAFELDIPYVEMLSDFLSRKDIPDDIKAMAAIARGKGFDEETVLSSLKETLAGRTKK